MNSTKMMVLLVLVAGCLRGASSVSAADAKAEVKLYPLSTCLITGEKLGGSMGKPYVITAQGQEIKFCCKGCLPEYEKSPADFLKKLEAAAKKAAQKNPYPLKVCLVSDEKLGGMGESYAFVYEDKEIKLCCQGCLQDFKKEPAKFMKKLEQAKK